MRNADGSVWINSFAHGRAVYDLKLDFLAAKAILERTPEPDAADEFVRLALAADLDEDEIETLRNLAHTRSGVTKPALDRKLKNARKSAAAARAKEEQDRRIAGRLDPRPQIDVPPSDAEYTPQMETINDVLRAIQASEPPTRNPNDRVALVRRLRTPSLHALTSKEANVNEV